MSNEDKSLEFKIKKLEKNNQQLENECVDLLTKIEFTNKKKQSISKKIQFLKQTLERLQDMSELS